MLEMWLWPGGSVLQRPKSVILAITPMGDSLSCFSSTLPGVRSWEGRGGQRTHGGEGRVTGTFAQCVLAACLLYAWCAGVLIVCLVCLICVEGMGHGIRMWLVMRRQRVLATCAYRWRRRACELCAYRVYDVLRMDVLHASCNVQQNAQHLRRPNKHQQARTQ